MGSVLGKDSVGIPESKKRLDVPTLVSRWLTKDEPFTSFHYSRGRQMFLLDEREKKPVPVPSLME